MKSILLIAALFFIAVNAQGRNFGSELANLPFGNVIAGPLTACIEAQVFKVLLRQVNYTNRLNLLMSQWNLLTKLVSMRKIMETSTFHLARES
jgi:hypothetical protein